MTIEQLTPEVLRLYRGFNAEADLTPEKLKALYDGLSWFPLTALRDGVTRALREPKLPWYDRFVALVDECAEMEREAEKRKADAQSQQFFERSPRGDDWAKAHHAAVVELVAGNRAGAIQLLEAINSPAAEELRRQAQ